jgi:L-fuconolactonase
VIDSHVHFWDPYARNHDWLPERLAQPYLPEDLDPDRHAPEEIVFVEADCRDEEALDEIAWAAELAEEDPRILGIVACAPLERGPGVLDAVVEHPLVVGVRRLIQGRPAEFALSENFVAGVRRLGELGIPFDACVTCEQLPVVAQLAAACPDTTIVLDHLGKPDVAHYRYDPWRTDLSAVAACPNTRCKLSGLATEADPARWETDVVWWMQYALAVFGPGRCLAGSDWPVVTLAATYVHWFDVLHSVLEDFNSGEREEVLEANAGQLYSR